MSGPDRPFSETEKNVLLAEIIKFSEVPPDALVDILRKHNVIPQWHDVTRPQGRSLQDCQRVYDEMLSGNMGQAAGISHASPWDNSATPRQYRPPGTYDGQAQYANIQPRPPNVPYGYGYGINTMEPPKKKRGRPSNAENERRRMEALARGQEWPPPGRKKKPSSASKQQKATTAESSTAATSSTPASTKPKTPTDTGTPSRPSAPEISPSLSSSRKRARQPLDDDNQQRHHHHQQQQPQQHHHSQQQQQQQQHPHQQQHSSHPHHHQQQSHGQLPPPPPPPPQSQQQPLLPHLSAPLHQSQPQYHATAYQPASPYSSTPLGHLQSWGTPTPTSHMQHQGHPGMPPPPRAAGDAMEH